ncbi:MAG: glycosyltransferase, partial [Polynucleobacter sp.]
RDFSRRDSRFKIIADEWNHLGPCQSFGKLLEHCSVEAPIFFCDQDDYWHPEKLRMFLSYFGNRLDSDEPLVVASDLALTDSHLKIRSPSMMR